MKRIKFECAIVTIFIFICSSCDFRSKNDQEILSNSVEPIGIDFFNESNLGKGWIDKRPIRLIARFDDCGEFGGYKEIIEISYESDNFIYSKLKKYSIYCGSIPPPPILKDEIIQPVDSIIYEKSVVLDIIKQKLVGDYIHNLVRSKFQENSFVHSGEQFIVYNYDSTLFISLYEKNMENNERYYQLIESLELQKKKCAEQCATVNRP